jgi:Coenzyme F420 hydrogenase/dehydrogenase, beta subunit C terminus.
MKVCHKITPMLALQKPVQTLACWTANLNDREHSSSGGAFSVIAKKVLKEGGIVFGAAMCEDLKVRHLSIDKVEDITLLQGSKYLQSYLGETYKNVKNELCTGRKVLFTGTPCQVAGLITYLRKSYQNLLTCDVVCHGVPSQKAFDIYIDKIGIRNKTRNFNFRFTKGWGYQLSRQLMSAKEGNSKRILISPKNSYYLRAFTRGLMFSEACYTCPYAHPERVGDFTLADYWGLGTLKPFNHPTHKGISLLFINNDKAKTFIKGCDDLVYEERPFEEAVEGNHNLSQVSSRPKGRDTYYDDSQKLSVSDLSKKYGIQDSIRDYLRLFKQILNLFR